MNDFYARMEPFISESGLWIEREAKSRYDCLISKRGKGESPYCSFENISNHEKVDVQIRQLNCAKYAEFRSIVLGKAKNLGVKIVPKKKITSKSSNRGAPYKKENCKMTFSFDSTSDAECKKIAQLLVFIYGILHETNTEWK